MMRISIAALSALLIGSALADAQQAIPKLAPQERSALFKAAGAVPKAGKWYGCTDDPNPQPATIDLYRDLNGDGKPEAIVSSYGSFCYGMTGQGYALLSRQANGSWRQIDGGSGIPEFLPTKGTGGWPDMSIGGPGFCFPVLRWNGRAYALQRHQYEGRPCRPNR